MILQEKKGDGVGILKEFFNLGRTRTFFFSVSVRGCPWFYFTSDEHGLSRTFYFPGQSVVVRGLLTSDEHGLSRTFFFPCLSGVVRGLFNLG